MKTCARCKQTKSLTDFCGDRKEKDGIRRWCRQCENVAAKKRWDAIARQQPSAQQVKLCECGCGQPTPLARQTQKSRGWIKGQPLDYINGHNDAGGGFVPVPLQDRFWQKVNKDGPIHPVLHTACWVWKGAHNPKGYGTVVNKGKHNYLAHRASWELNNGPIPDALLVCHHCDNPACVRPDHLFLGTHQDNMTDAKLKGRLNAKPRPENFVHYNKAKTHCRRGHPLSGDNLHLLPDGRRECRECSRATKRRHAEKKKSVRWAGDLGGVEFI